MVDRCPKCGSYYVRSERCQKCKWKEGEKKDYSWIWYIVGFVVLLYVGRGCSTSGSRYPMDSQPSEDYADQLEMDEINQEAEQYQQYQEEMRNTQVAEDREFIEPVSSSCSGGCISHLVGCDIKGNVSFDTGEKIYHVPGGKYYSKTKIDTSYGERWFCTEQEARDAGWRLSAE